MFNKKRNVRGQVTIFIIIAIVIIAAGVSIYIFYPKIKTTTETAKNPAAFIQSCLEDEIEEVVKNLSLQGGSANPEHYYLYMNNAIEYLCYAGDYYKLCVVQQPLLKSHIESEIEKEIKDEATACFQELTGNYEEKGYDVELNEREVVVKLFPERIVTNFNYELTITKGESERYESFDVVLNNNLYELVSVARDIIEEETTKGDADYTLYMTYYPWLKTEKYLQQDGTTIYILTDRDSENKFQFASRSLAWPLGFT